MIQKNQMRFSGWQSMIFMALAVVVFFVIARAIFNLLYFIAVPLLIITAIINHKVILNYFKNIGNLYRKNIGWGIGATALSAVFYPVVILFLFLQAMAHRKVAKMQEKQNTNYQGYEGSMFREGTNRGEYVDYEEVRTHNVEHEDLLESLNKRPEKEEDKNDYWDLFDNNDNNKK